MTDVNFTVAAGADDGWGYTDEASFSISSNSLFLGNYFGDHPVRSFFRFDDVSIPIGATIDNAYVRFISNIDGSTTTVNVNCYFEDADDPAAPTTAADLMARSLTTGVAWNGLSAWTNGNTYDSPDISAALQDVIDRGGWASGQAVIALFDDNGSGSGKQRQPSSYDYDFGDINPGDESAILYVSYSVPFNIDVSDSIEITEPVSVLKDTVDIEDVSDDLTVSEFVTVERDRHIDVEDGLTVSESVQAIPTFSGELTEAQNIEVSEYVILERGFSGQLVESDNIQISEFRDLVLEGPKISVFESLTISEQIRMTNFIELSDSITLSESITARRGYDGTGTDSFVFADSGVLFHYSNWLRQNAARANQRFFFTLTGDSDSTTDIEIPISSIYARKRSGDPTYLQVVIPSFNYSGEVANRPSGAMIVEMGYEVDGEINLREQILIADLEDIRLDEGAVNRSITLSGHRTINYGGNLVTFQRKQVTYRAVQTRARAFRFAFIDPFLSPGDTVIVGDESFTCNNITYIVNALRSMMEVREAI